MNQAKPLLDPTPPEGEEKRVNAVFEMAKDSIVYCRPFPIAPSILR